MLTFKWDEAQVIGPGGGAAAMAQPTANQQIIGYDWEILVGDKIVASGHVPVGNPLEANYAQNRDDGRVVFQVYTVVQSGENTYRGEPVGTFYDVDENRRDFAQTIPPPENVRKD